LERKGIKIGLILSGVAASIIGVLAVVAAVNPSPALATPGRTTDCTSCHPRQAGSLRVTTDTNAKTVAPGAQFTVNTSFTGGGAGLTEINWPDVQANTQFAPTPRVPFSATASTASGSSTLTAPTTPGTYTVRVYAAQKTPLMESDYKDMTITVSAPVPVTYTVAVSAGANGSISPSGTVTVNSGASQTFTITANTGYHVSAVTVDGGSAGAVNTYTFSNLVANHTISATFAADAASTPPPASSYTITASAGANGSISPSGAVTVNSGASQTFTITANTGYHVSAVTVDGGSAGAVSTYTFANVVANHTISATFAADSAGTPPPASSYTITASAGANGSISPPGAVAVNSGASQTFSITANTGYHVSAVTVDGVLAGAVSTYSFSNVVANHTISATFAADTAGTSTPPPVLFTITASAGAHGSITPSGVVTVNAGASQNFAFSADSGHMVADVQVDGSSIGKPACFTFTGVGSPHTICVTFAAMGRSAKASPEADDDDGGHWSREKDRRGSMRSDHYSPVRSHSELDD
jgi:hypothetical protein